MGTHTNGVSAADYEADLDQLYAWIAPPTPPPAPLPEAPASVNVKLTINGRDCQLTLRDQDEGRLLERLAAVLAQYPAAAPVSPQRPDEGYCLVHETTMYLNHGKDGRQWYSHRLPEGGFCKGVRK